MLGKKDYAAQVFGFAEKLPTTALGGSMELS
jgi:hypothetical protein